MIFRAGDENDAERAEFIRIARRQLMPEDRLHFRLRPGRRLLDLLSLRLFERNRFDHNRFQMDGLRFEWKDVRARRTKRNFVNARCFAGFV